MAQNIIPKNYRNKSEKTMSDYYEGKISWSKAQEVLKKIKKVNKK